jgi:hypothetical protein
MAKQPAPLELSLLVTALDEEFGTLITGVGKTDDDRRKNFLSKAVGAFSLGHEAGATPEIAAQAVVDGGGDHGLDAVYVSTDNTLWLVQAKFISSGSGEPDLGDVSKFRDGIEDLLAIRFDRFNDSVKKKSVEIKAALHRGGCRVRVVLAYTGTAISEDRRNIFSDLEHRYNGANPGFLRCYARGIGSLHGFQLEAQAAVPINTEIELKDFGHINAPYRGFYGRLTARQLSELVKVYDDRVVEKNIRRFRGSTAVNDGMLATLHNESEHFFYFNNGVTFLCDSIKQLPPFDPSRQTGRFDVDGLSVINGAQTVGSIGREPADYYDSHPAEVLATFISLENAPDSFGDQVTQFRNRQNAVDLEDFAGLDERQESWKGTLALAGITYLYKHGDDDPLLSSKVFSVREAAPALACCRTSADWVDYIIVTKQDPKRLFRKPNLAETADTLQDSYEQIFTDSLTARELWRAVQIYRLVKMTIEERVLGESDLKNSEILRNGTWLMLHVLSIKVPIQNGIDIELPDADKQRLSIAIDAIAHQLIECVNSQQWEKEINDIFEDATDCQTIKRSMMAALTQPL